MDRCLYRSRVADRPFAPSSLGRAGRLSVVLLLALVSAPLPARAEHTSPFLDLQFMAYSGRGGVAFENPLAVAVNPKGGEYAVANSGRGRIEILDLEGHSTAYIEHRVRRPDGSTVLGQPAHLCYSARGEILVVDNLERDVDVLAPNGRSIGRIALPASRTAAGAACDSTAGAITRLADGSLLVATRGNPARIWRFDPDGRPLGAWGVPGEGKGQLSGIAALAQAPSGEIVVACAGTELAIQRFSAQGEFIAGFGRHELGPGNASLPSGIAISPDGRMWISDELRQAVQVFDREGMYLGIAGGGGPEPGSFLFPSDVQNDGADRLLVVDRVAGRMQGFRILDDTTSFQEPTHASHLKGGEGQASRVQSTQRPGESEPGAHPPTP